MASRKVKLNSQLANPI